MTTKTYTKTCRICSQSFQSYQNSRKPVVCFDAACLNTEIAEAAAINAKIDAEWAARPKQTRQPRTVWMSADSAAILGLNGIKAGR